MKKYLVRSPFDPGKSYDPYRAMALNIIGNNSGNLFFSYSVINALTTDRTSVDIFYDWNTSKWAPEEVERINSTYDAVVLPLADAFRKDYISHLKCFTSLIKQLTIPCVVTGVGVRADYDDDFTSAFPFDDAALNFIKAVLEHSDTIGLRGERTGRYLEKLGFSEGRDFTVIGCPSLYLYGDSVRLRSPEHYSRIASNGNSLSPRSGEFIRNTLGQAEDFCFILQQMVEFNDMFYNSEQPDYIFPRDQIEELFRLNKAKMFFSVPQWIDYVGDFDFFIGSRFHGSVAAVLSGTPQIFIPFNSRTRELAEFHHLTCLDKDNLPDSAFDCLDSLDFGSFYAHQTENFANYVRFLDKNGLDNIFSSGLPYSRGQSPLEKEIAGLKQYSIDAYLSLSDFGRLERRLGAEFSRLYGLERRYRRKIRK